MKRFCAAIFLCSSLMASGWGSSKNFSQPVLAEEKTSADLGGIKEKIETIQKKCADASGSEKSPLFFELAKVCYQDQEVEQAFVHFLSALKYAKAEPVYVASDEEQKLYDEALGEYLKNGGADPLRAAVQLLKNYGPIAETNQNYLLLNLLTSTAYANLGKYSEFFEKFYASFPVLQNSFLAHKTRAILFLRLAQRSIQEEEKQFCLNEAYNFLTKALEKCPDDASIYKVLIFLAKEEKNEHLILTYLHRMIEAKVFIPRGDIYLYVREAVAQEDFAIAQKIIDHASTLYEYSRAIAAAQDYLNQHKGT